MHFPHALNTRVRRSSRIGITAALCLTTLTSCAGISLSELQRLGSTTTTTHINFTDLDIRRKIPHSLRYGKSHQG